MNNPEYENGIIQIIQQFLQEEFGNRVTQNIIIGLSQRMRATLKIIASSTPFDKTEKPNKTE